MNILLINYEFPPIGGGAATATHELAQALQSLGNAVTVLTAGIGPLHGVSIDRQVEVLRVRSRRASVHRSSFWEKLSFVCHAAVEIPQLVRRIRPDGCIVFFSMPCGPLGLLVKALTGARYVISLRGGDVPGTEPSLNRMHKLLAPVRRWALRGAVVVVANSMGLKKLSEAADPVEVTVIPNGVDTRTFYPRKQCERKGFRFLFVGRLTSQKNVTLLLGAAQLLRTQSAVRFVVEIVGEGPLEHELRSKCRDLGLEAIVHWRPWIAREQMRNCYVSADCLVNPSRYEGMPNTVLEAMACGVPVIVSDVAGNMDAVERGISGLVFPDNDAPGLAAAMRILLEDAATAGRLGAAGHQRAHDAFTWKSSATAYLSALAASRAGHRAPV